jgi:pyrroloquinoline quinone (PQQ) biosynthesis protein C
LASKGTVRDHALFCDPRRSRRAGRHLLTHPFYCRWEAGAIGLGELAAYAEQYRLIERQLPLTLAGIAAQLPEGAAKSQVEANLADELHSPAPHTELFESFAKAAGARSDVGPTAATTNLLASIRATVATDPTAALAMVAAYEWQGADIAASKSKGLQRHFNMDAEATEFWDVHAALEADHAEWSIEALRSLRADPRVVTDFARRSAEDWWNFLDEREERATAAAC